MGYVITLVVRQWQKAKWHQRRVDMSTKIIVQQVPAVRQAQVMSWLDAAGHRDLFPWIRRWRELRQQMGHQPGYPPIDQDDHPGLQRVSEQLIPRGVAGDEHYLAEYLGRILLASGVSYLNTEWPASVRIDSRYPQREQHWQITSTWALEAMDEAYASVENYEPTLFQQENL